jgi:hypothetical protein
LFQVSETGSKGEDKSRSAGEDGSRRTGTRKNGTNTGPGKHGASRTGEAGASSPDKYRRGGTG